MNGAFTRYLELHVSLLLERAARSLTLEEEAGYAEELDRCWVGLSDEEQDDIEVILAAAAPEAPPQLDVEDAPTAVGTTAPPRRAA